MKFRKFQQMEQYYAQQAQLPHFSGPARQREGSFGSLAAGVGRVALATAKKFLLPAVKSNSYHKAYPSCLTCHQKRKHQKKRFDQLSVKL